MSYLTTNGPAADPVTRLGSGLIALSLAVIAIILGLLLWAMYRSRPAPPTGAEGHGSIGRGGSGLPFIYIGAGVSTVVLFAFTIWSLTALATVANPPRAPGLTIQVTAHQFWWEVRYLGADGRSGFLTANEIHIPVGEPVRVELSSADVIHSFWVPKLAGKTQLIPGQTNVKWLQADTAGTYRGQCSQFCGLQHAHMAMLVVADAPDAFAAWWDRQLAQPAPVVLQASPQVADGQHVFQVRCASCHAVRGTGAGGLVGPNLSHLMSRQTLAAGMIPNDGENLAFWINNSQTVKPGSAMPMMLLRPADLSAVVAYLQTLD